MTPGAAAQQGSSAQPHDTSPDQASPWRDLIEFAGPAIYGRSCVPWLRLTLTLAVLAVVVVTVVLNVKV
jgi:hypothetical protein